MPLVCRDGKRMNEREVFIMTMMIMNMMMRFYKMVYINTERLLLMEYDTTVPLGVGC